MSKPLTILIFLIIFSSCKNNSIETEKEIQSVQKVLDFYGGKCIKHKGFKTEKENSIKFYELEMLDSDFLDKNYEILKSLSGNIAYLFYSNLDNEKENYNQVRVTINSKNGTKSEYHYSETKLEQIERLIPNIENISNYILNKDYDSIYNLFDKSIELKIDDIKNIYTKIENDFGKLKKSQIRGFEFYDEKEFDHYLKVEIVQIRENKNLIMILIFNRNNSKLIGIDYL
ncbi:hypothetical protein SAMN05444411_1401 [Lutibacter oricola]|uniref:Uncharacterized protein n=1 Tax=Lutibacter oricola TaxID=762486 RepID=A0A1H3HHH0_9FLAO|nr:hypothetical protein [Lutibacter oricola]SDY14901.1 hypothetical protein SAMN05444411_1401 [Lutibacter oricola]